jgi:leader peptidase (prepilin peptidase) / N-methyltransferase
MELLSHLESSRAFLWVVAGVLGLCVGSFLNVVIHRVPRRQSVVRPRSRCTSCGTRLAGRDNVPVVSWLALGRRCRTCHRPIPWRYPLVEVGTALLFALAALRFGADWALPAYLLCFATLLAVALIDLEHFIVPNRIVFPVLYASVPLLGAAAALGGEWDRFGTAVVGAVAASGSLLAINLVSPRGMGMGDVKLALVLGLYLGWLGLGHVALGLFLGFLLGALVGLLLIALGLRSRRDHVPFAPFLAAGTIIAVLVGAPILDWYRG